ncbi:hypothetical protein B0H17DRAFT_1280578 [Mycena rosella]|uniref:Uncharacterized protein n=1 Tax=Mycena rosella TaxID=1033263 RepID=A0AAD7BY27_MYCRO|nr:hypothetical protein B0H17DRAFT_1280578 [Mycena rosella]
MPSHQSWNPVSLSSTSASPKTPHSFSKDDPNLGRPLIHVPNSTPSAQHPSSPSSVDQRFISVPELYLLQPPPAPRLPNIPLPDFAVAHRHPPAPSRRDVLPIDLNNEVDFELLAGSIPNYSIPPHTTIDILPSSREFILLQITTGDRPTTAFSVIRSLQRIMRAPLSLQVFTAELPPVVNSRSTATSFRAAGQTALACGRDS